MRRIIEVNTATIENNQIILTGNTESISEMIPKEQMLVDSDKFAFIYIVEYENEYAYIQLSEETWETLSEGLKHNMTVVFKNKEYEMELPNFAEELAYLIDNIKDNANYGNEMNLKVEKVFM